MPINKEKLQAREEARVSRPEFIRPESWRYKRLETNWRKPKGIDNHQRKQKSRGRPGLVKVGYGTPKIAYGLHPSGYYLYNLMGAIHMQFLVCRILPLLILGDHDFFVFSDDYQFLLVFSS